MYSIAISMEYDCLIANDCNGNVNRDVFAQLVK